MFRNLGLPSPFIDLFPLPTITFSQLPASNQGHIRAALPNVDINSDTLLRPAERTMPMGFTWAVVLAHVAMTNIVRTAHTITRMSKSCPASIKPLHLLSRADAPFDLSPGAALALAIIDYISFLLCDWPEQLTHLLHRTLRTLLTAAGLPIAGNKSLPVGQIETKKRPFIGMNINLQTKQVTSIANRINKLAAFIKYHNFTSVAYTVWTSLMGKLVTYAKLHRGILSRFDTVYRHTSHVLPNNTNKAAHVKLIVSEQQKDEVKRIISLLPFAKVRLKLPISTLFIDFDASRTAAKVMYTRIEHHEAQMLWAKAVKRAATKDVIPLSDPELEALTTSKSWSIAVHQPCRKTKTKLPHINALEAVIANIAADWTTRQQPQPAHLIILTYSAVVLGAYKKDSSSNPWLLDKVRRFKSIRLASGLRIILLHIRTKFNTADPHLAKNL